MDLGELGGDDGSGHPVVGGQAGEGFVVVLTGDPYGLAIGEAGCLGEDHRIGVGGTESIVADRGSVEPVAQEGDRFGGGVQVAFVQTFQCQVQVAGIDPIDSKICQFISKVQAAGAEVVHRIGFVWYGLILQHQRPAFGRQ
jgi:hypothetical protein